MRIACLSDSHGKHDQVEMPDNVDIILHAGDFTGSGQVAETKAFLEWFNKQDAPHKIFISGNHDYMDQEQPNLFKEILKEYPNITYLRDEGTTICGIKIWGRPWTPEYCGWAFMADPGSHKMLSTLSIIPADTDILLTHGPAKGILDTMNTGQSVGCTDLRIELDSGRIKPRAVVFGHIHHSAGQLEHNGIKYINAAVLNDQYEYKNQPIVIEIP